MFPCSVTTFRLLRRGMDTDGILVPGRGRGPWEWKGTAIRKTGCTYGKFFRDKAAFIRRQGYRDFINYRRNGDDFDTRHNDLVPSADKLVYDLLESGGPCCPRS